jgi:Adenylate and Guanylate cyclase catalytic domain
LSHHYSRKNVHERLLAAGDKKGGNRSMVSANESCLRSFLNDGGIGGLDDSDQPIADLFPECTVFFADIAGFTAWSATREPAQVFILLQTVFQKFDSRAKQRKVFKVETIGDCYMAVTGLPEPMMNHAVTMVRFAWDCLYEFRLLTKELESSLGPETGKLFWVGSANSHIKRHRQYCK